MTVVHENLGLVAIGRNEGQRLGQCLASVVGGAASVVYVDSGSTDGSLELARSLGVEVVELDTTRPFTAARARNAGYEQLKKQRPDLTYVMFVDADCEVVEGWLDIATQALDRNEELAAVCGRLRECLPDATIFQQLIDMEWDTPVGVARSCGGNAVYRTKAFDEVSGFDPSFICGEEPQLCLRLRQAGWIIERLDTEMALHDAAMTRWSQWWKRNVRGGWSYAEGADKYGHLPERYKVKEARSNWIWGLTVPAMILALLVLGAVVTWWCWLGAAVLLMGYPVLVWRVVRYRCQRGDSFKKSSLYGVLTVLGKIPNAVGQVRYRVNCWRGKPATLIEYKRVGPDAPAEGNGS